MRSLALRKTALALTSSLFAVLLAAEAGAAPPAKGAPPAGPNRSSAQFTLHRDEPGGPDAIAARGKARAGDCAGALGLFDLALRHTNDPALRRDRGLCHEKQNHPFPAIDDYRYYLHMKPEASDAEQIRERLARLEEQVGQGGRSSQAAKDSKDDGSSASASGSMETSSSGGSAEASASFSVGGSASGSGKKRRDEPTVSEKNYDEYQAQEKLADAADNSPLRYGEGFILGAYVLIPRYFVGEGTSKDMAYGVGGRLGYAFSSTATFVGEVGYAGIGEGGANTSASGPQLMLGLEGRFPISRYGSDQILLGGGLGFERYVVSGTRIGADFVMGRFKLAYRHVFGPSLALDIGADGGPALVLPDGGGDSRVIGAIGGAAALVVAF